MVTYATGTIGSQASIGDFNGDGIQDIAVLSYANNITISVLLGSRMGTLTLKTTSVVLGRRIYQMIVIDLNNDKHSDFIILADDPQSIDVYLTNNSMILASHTKYRIWRYPFRNVIIFGDLNNDSIPDLITFENVASNLYVFLGTSNGTFDPKNSYSANNEPSLNRRPLVADFNGDNNLDVVIFDDRGTNSIYIFFGYGNGTLRPRTKYVGDSYSYIIAINDFNGDNIADLLAANYSTSNINVLLGYGNGTFRKRITYDIGFYPFLVTVGDFNNDNISDLFIINYYGNITIGFLGNGNGTFKIQMLDAVGFYPAAVAVDDFNGDNKNDLVLINAYGNLTIAFLSNGDGSFRKQLLNTVGFNPESVLIGDFNGDNKKDLAVITYDSNNVGVFLNTC
jgi:hypothetical protein